MSGNDPTSVSLSRRTALQSAAAGAATLASVGGAHADNPSSDTIKVGLIGAGGRGTGALQQTLSVPGSNVKLMAVADAFQYRVDNVLRAVEKMQDKVDCPEERRFTGLDAYRRLIELPDLDLVILATPPGFRPYHFEAAIKAGKHVFMEKPVCVDSYGARLVMEVAKLADEKKRKVVVGLQRRYENRYRETIARIREGLAGDIIGGQVYWNGGGVWTRARTPEQTEMEYQMRNWYYFVWLCGDHICEQHVHNLDVVNWVKGGHPVEANGMGGRQVRKGPDHGQIYDHHFIEFTYEDGTKMYSQCRHIRRCWNSVSEAAVGTKGSSNCAGKIEGANPWRFEGKRVSGHQQEQTDLAAALRAGRRYNEAPYGATSSFTAVLGRMATYSGQVVRWDDAVKKGPEEVPYGVELTFETEPPVLPGPDGEYPVAMPGVYKAY